MIAMSSAVDRVRFRFAFPFVPPAAVMTSITRVSRRSKSNLKGFPKKKFARRISWLGD
jgi:hypothetical protein